MVDISDQEILADLLNKFGFSKTIYNAIGNKDPADTVLATLDMIKRHFEMICQFLRVSKDVKSEEESEKYRRIANDAYLKYKYQIALEFYNKALLYAPANSQSMKYAYSSRSAVLIKMNAYQACLYDIDTCFIMGCPPNIIDKLKKRREEAYDNVWKEKLGKEVNTTDFNKDFFEIKVKRNAQIPVATADIGIIMESRIPKVVAVNDIKVGSLLAVETAFVSNTASHPNQKISCYYCQKISLNLKPCDGCVRALFCSENCRQKCLVEYHKIECHILASVSMANMSDTDTLMLKALLKVKSLTTWNEFIEAAKVWGVDRIKNSSVNEIFDSKFSVLCFNENTRHFIDGKMYNAGFLCALYIRLLEDTDFFPKMGKERAEAIRAFSRMLLLCYIHGSVLLINQMIRILSKNDTRIHHTPNFGCFSFMGKLKHDCNANSLLVSLNNKLALVALTPIERGTEITASRIHNWLDVEHDSDRYNYTYIMYKMFNIVCNCLRCTGGWKSLSISFQLNEKQRSMCRRLNLIQIHNELNRSNVHKIYPVLCKAMPLFSEMPYCCESINIYKVFRKCLLILQDCCTDNILFDPLYD